MPAIDYQTLVRWINKYPTIPLIWLLFAIGKIRSLCGTTERERPVKKILVIKLAGLGDAVLMLRPVRALRRAFPHAHIEMLAAPSSSDVFFEEPAVDSVRVYDLFGSQKGLRYFINLIRILIKQHFDLVCDFEQHTLMVAVMSWFTGASRRIGFAAEGNMRALLLTEAVPLDGDRHMADFYCELAGRAGAPGAAEESGDIVFGEDCAHTVRKWFAQTDAWKKNILIGMHPGSAKRCTARRWFPERFALLIDKIHDTVDATIFLTGKKEEAGIVESIADRCTSRPIMVPHEFSGKELACLIGFLDLFISNDTGPMHIGPAVGTPTIGLFGPNSPVRYRPLGPVHRAVYKGASCSPCINIHLGQAPDCSLARPRCMDAIGVDDVLYEVLDMLRENSPEQLCRSETRRRV